MICCVQFQFRTLDLWQNWGKLYSIVSTRRLNGFWQWESVSLSDWEMMPNYHWNWDDWWTRSWCRGTMQCFNHGSQMKACCPMSTVLLQGRLTVTSCPFQPRAGSQFCPCFVPFPDGWQTSGCVRVGVEACLCLAVLPRANCHFKRAECQWFVTAEWPFSGPGTDWLFFQTDTLPSFCVRAQKLSSFADWLGLSYFFLGCWSL